ncbi:MAG: hypothetical protein A2452_00770 [Candidatus Firestonebacteria bacterium RIFOXYC2_FULL_39_67]|nr:MAG: hypothetical protein A2536_06320 [Candidatus Firestonebacteria bacterium RIFOXYD2_FULL_39_29]OGF56085.1 MAG: hypothetical protein A2452_00770 [Candidatus Firestonebacteria bacterium RIFOXYC2_FULL_39_67]OGF56466.1 MAG: hypothetical protein A2497_08265 [Candidatus Firestonebacteria bacterium RifOxyC12_full_39_7]
MLSPPLMNSYIININLSAIFRYVGFRLFIDWNLRGGRRRTEDGRQMDAWRFARQSYRADLW